MIGRDRWWAPAVRRLEAGTGSQKPATRLLATESNKGGK